MSLKAVAIIGLFTFFIHLAESLAYTMRLAGIRTRQIAISLSFVTTALLISRLSNMGQAAFLGSLVDTTVRIGTQAARTQLECAFRSIIVMAFLGSLLGTLLAPTMTLLLQKAIMRFLKNGSMPQTMLSAFRLRNLALIFKTFRMPRLKSLADVSWQRLPKNFLIMNVFVTAIYTIGVLCSLLAGAYLPELRSTAVQLSGIVNGLATIMFATIVDPSGARITDQANHGLRPEADVKSVVFFLLMGRLIGTLIIAQLLFWPFAQYIMLVTKLIASHFG